MARLNVDLSEVDASSGGGQPLPPGRYQLQVIEEDLSRNGKDTGDLLKLTYEVLGPTQAGRRIWVNMNVTHDNPVAQKIGQEELKALCSAIGEPDGVDDTERLLWVPFEAETKITVDKGDGRERAAVKKYLFGEALDAPPEKTRPTPPTRPAGPAHPAGRPASPPGRPAGAAGGGARTLPWKDRQGGQPPANSARQPARPANYDLDDDIPF